MKMGLYRLYQWKKNDWSKDRCRVILNCSLPSTGPKGVINDFRKYKQMKVEQKQEQKREMERLIKKLSMTCRSDLDLEKDEEKKKQLQEKIKDKVRVQT